MEQLQSTEILDREILEDARKKALRILKTADDTVRAQNEEWENKTTRVISELEKKYNSARELATVKEMARLPIDKHRIKIEKIESMLRSAVESWYKEMSRPKILDMLKQELSNQLASCEELKTSSKINVYYSGLEHSEAEMVLKNVAHCSLLMANSSLFPSLELESEDVRITASIQKIIDSLLLDKREELIEALVGRDFMEDL